MSFWYNYFIPSMYSNSFRLFKSHVVLLLIIIPDRIGGVFQFVTIIWVQLNDCLILILDNKIILVKL